ncbi:APC family permease [Glycomyces buryatensis]|uniref:Uncharacterized protein n=1 Tax=Glycomyces buryatensis TaxID=2570927 RepID=A0A4S8Q6E9_9ACTN|nr:APC family permease [Glycomyces buryatensis]THV39700.1 hypothetical protein FAB82_17130 [Glycomyces buryatensis]
MTDPGNRPPEDDDGGTFKLKPGSQPKAEPQQPQEENLDGTMKIKRVGGGPGGGGSVPPPPPSPLGNPTGPADPPQMFGDTTVMPQQGGSQTGFQPASQPAGQPGNPLGGQQLNSPPPGPQPYGQQPGYGQQPPPGQLPHQQGQMPQPQTAPPQGTAPQGVVRIGLMAMIGAAVGVLGNIVSMAMGANGFAVVIGIFGILFALAFGWYGYALPKGKIASSGLRQAGVILMMIGAVGSVFVVLSALTTLGVPGAGGVSAVSLVTGVLGIGIYGFVSFIYIKDKESSAWIKGTPAMGAQPGYPHQGGYGQQPGQPGAYPPPGYPQQGQPGQPGGQPPYGR